MDVFSALSSVDLEDALSTLRLDEEKKTFLRHGISVCSIIAEHDERAGEALSRLAIGLGSLSLSEADPYALPAIKLAGFRHAFLWRLPWTRRGCVSRIRRSVRDLRTFSYDASPEVRDAYGELLDDLLPSFIEKCGYRTISRSSLPEN